MFTALPYAGAALLGIALGRLSDRILTHDTVEQGRRRSMGVAMMLSRSVILLTPFVEQIWLMMVLFTLCSPAWQPRSRSTSRW